MSNKVMIITGMHRSGTSLVSHWLKCCGLNLGEIFLGADIGNVEGHFEDIDFYRFHEDTLDAHNLSRYGFITQCASELTTYEKERLAGLIDFKNRLNNEWGWKDPRTCLFLAHYRALLPGAFYLNIIRDYKSTVNSLIGRDFKHHEKKYLSGPWLSKFIWKAFRRSKTMKKFYFEWSEFYLKIWVFYNEEILKNIAYLGNGRHLTINYLSLINDDKSIFNRLTNDWPFNLYYYDFKLILKENLFSRVVDIDSFIGHKSLLTEAKKLEKTITGLMHLEKKITERVAVVIPMYRNELSDFEEASLKQCMTVLHQHKIIVVKPRSLTLTVLSEYDFIEYISFEDSFFKSRRSYNHLMLFDGFYERFMKFEYILIYQLDAFVFKDDLLAWCDKNYDYIGAPWLKPHKYIDVVKAIKSKFLIYVHTRLNLKQPGTDLPTDIQFENKVGNGGLSLRRVQKFHNATKKYRDSILDYVFRPEHYFNEDVWWSIELNRKRKILNIPVYQTAVFFSFENEPQRAFELTGHQLPFACHAWNQHWDFWQDKINIEKYAFKAVS